MEKRTTTRADLLNAVSASAPNLTRAEAREMFELTLDEIASALVRGEQVNLRAFGSFSVRSKSQRIGRNPRTGVAATITPRRVLTFKASPRLTQQVNDGKSAN